MQLFSHKNAATQEEKNDNAKQVILSSTNLIYDILKTTLGPSGTLKLFAGKNILLSNDGATIMKNLLIDSAPAQLLINASISQDKEEGDGTTSVSILTALLVKEAYNLDIHPLKIIKGYEIALQKIEETLHTLILEDKTNVSINDIMTNENNTKINLAKTTLNSKVLNCDLDLFANIVVNAYNNLEEKDLKLINIIKAPGKLEDSFYSDGFILDKDTDINIEKPRILVANTAMDFDKIKVFGAKVEVQSVSELVEIEQAEKRKMYEKVQKICYETNEIQSNKIESTESNNLKSDNIVDSNKLLIDVFINRQLIYDYPKKLFKQNNVIPIEHADFDGVTRLSNILNAKIISSFYKTVDKNSIGTCQKIENIYIGEKKMIKFSGIQKGAGTIVLKGSSADILEEAERSVHDALCVLRDDKVVCGGGSVEIELASQLIKYSSTISGVESEAVLAFAKALSEIPKIISDNCGFDGEKIKSMLRAEHEMGNKHAGVDVDNGCVCDMREKKIFDSYNVKLRVIKAAVETAQILIKCDGIVKCKPRERTRH
ncbi:T-complex protein 1 subunit beta [Binucleata daphniae]